jgi:hypothetical protein
MGKNDAIEKAVRDGLIGMTAAIAPVIRTWIWAKTYREVLKAALRGGQEPAQALDVAEKAAQVVDQRSEKFGKEASEKIKELDKNVREAIN